MPELKEVDNKVKYDIIAVLNKVIYKLQHKDLQNVTELSNEIIHCASIFQDELSISIAVISYALFKILERDNHIEPEFITHLIRARHYLEKNNIVKFSKEIKRLSSKITQKDKEMNLYIRHVFNEAEIKKGSKIYEHGISLAQTAKLLNISQWELMKYIGKTKTVDKIAEKISAKERLFFTRRLFGL